MDFKRQDDGTAASNDTLVNEHNLMAGAKKTLPVLGYLEFVDASAGIKLPLGTLVALYREGATTGYVALALGTQPAAPAAPAAAGAGIIQLRPNDYTIVSMGPNSWIRTGAGVTAYKVVDGSKLLAR